MRIPGTVREDHGDPLFGFVGERPVKDDCAVANADVAASFAGVLVESAMRTGQD